MPPKFVKNPPEEEEVLLDDEEEGYEDDEEYEDEAYDEDEYDEEYDDDYYDNEDEEPQGYLARFLTFAVVVFAITGFVWLAWYAYTVGTAPTDPSEVPLITADAGPVMVEPEDPGGLQVPFQDKEVYENIAGERQPLPRVERIMALPDQPIRVDEEPDAQAQIAIGEAAIAEQEARQLSELAPAGQTAGQAASQTVTAQAANPAPAVSSQEPEIKYVKDEAEAPAAKAEAPHKASASKVPASDPDPVHAAEPRTETPTPKPKEIAALSSQKTQPGGQHRASIAGMKIQLGSFRSENQAKSAWDTISGSHKSELGGLNYTVQKADLGSKGVFYRLQAGPVSGEDKAKSLCATLSAKGQGCLVVR